ncbi:MAG: cytidine deaminase [Calditrichia bacterium]
MSLTEKEIISLLKQTQKEALALYSNFRVAAVLLTADEDVFTGINIESSSYGLTICAERVAMFKALSEGERDFRKIYILADMKTPCPPCGACRQILMDFAPDIEVVMVAANDSILRMTLKELLPHAFDGSQL